MAAANRHFLAGELDAARELYLQVLEQRPLHAKALHMLSGIHAAHGNLEMALKLEREAIALQPANAVFHLSLGRLLRTQSLHEQAVDAYRRALQLGPSQHEWRLELDATLIQAGRIDEAVLGYARVKPPDARAYFDLGEALHGAAHYKEAEKAFLQSAAMAPEFGGIHACLAMALRGQGRPVDAEAPARRATEVAPDMPQGWFVLGSVLAMQGRHLEAVEHYRRAISLLPEYDDAWDCMLLCMHYSEAFSPRQLFAAHASWGTRFPEVAPLPVRPSHRAVGHRLRVAYLSGDFFQHPVAQFLEPALRAHDRSRFEILCYHVGACEDAWTMRLKSYPEHWRRLRAVSDDDLEKVLLDDRIDVLVELSGHTQGQRLAVLARRVAPVQVSYLGYPNTTGLKSIDYRITDALADPPGETDALHVERLVRLPETFLCYSPSAVGPDRRTTPLRRRGHVTFGSFNNFAKISAKSIALWAAVLRAVPDSKIMIKARWLQDPGLRASIAARLCEHGIDDSRLVIAEPNPDHRQHMQAYDQVDIALDTFPYHGTTTTLDALWMNVPVITLAGGHHASRVGVSILSNLGLPQLIARSEEEYVALATALASDAHQLDDYARSLRARLKASPLMDGPRFTRHLEGAYLRMWADADAASHSD